MAKEVGAILYLPLTLLWSASLLLDAKQNAYTHTLTSLLHLCLFRQHTLTMPLRTHCMRSFWTSVSTSGFSNPNRSYRTRIHDGVWPEACISVHMLAARAGAADGAEDEESHARKKELESQKARIIAQMAPVWEDDEGHVAAAHALRPLPEPEREEP
ncbi:hypothetical protein JOM56_015631 [Amanita muscaria]